MDTFLTLVIALGGIATGIGAIWTAVAARRQAQLTERSLTEQNERARLNLEYDLLTRLGDRMDNPQYQRTTKAAAKYLLDNAFVDDGVVEMERLNYAVAEVCNFFEEVGEMLRLGVLSDVSVWNRYSTSAYLYWSACKPSIEKMREEHGDPAYFEEFEYLCRVVDEMDRKRGIPPLTLEQLRQYMELNATMDEEPPTTTTE
jgi:hypothetical protein